MNYLCHAESLC